MTPHLVPSEEMEALSALHSSTNGDQWRWRRVQDAGPIWNFTLDAGGNFVDNPCSSSQNMTWQGVDCSHPPDLCSSQTCHISGISLPFYSPAGTIPPEIGQLQSLSYLDLQLNNLSGRIPSEIGQLQGMSYLDLQRNFLTGPISSELGSLTTLQVLSLHTNQLTQTIPSSLWQLTGLRVLVLYFNHLTGSISPEVGQLTGCVILSLYDNLLTGSIPSSVGNLTTLETFALYNNYLNGSLPAEIGQMDSVLLLVLYGNELTGSIPAGIGDLASVDEIYLYDNFLTGSIPQEIGQLSALERFYVYFNRLTGTIPQEIGQLQAMEGLTLYDNQLTGTIPSSMWQLTKLEVLYVYGNQLSGSISAEVGQLEILERLVVSSNHLTGSIPSELGSLLLLEQLYFYDNQLTGTLPSSIGSLVKLHELWLYDNSLSGTLPPQMHMLSGVETVFLQNNFFSGDLQGVFNHSTQRELSDIDMSNNQLADSFSQAEEIFLLPALKVLSLSVNCFQGSLSDRLCGARRAEVLSLNGLRASEGCADRVVMPLSGVGLLNNAVGGTVPACVWSMPEMRVLHLTGNGLTGGLPRTLPASTLLNDLSLSHNQMSGSISRDIFNISSLDLSHNHFSGEYNQAAAFTDWASLTLGLEVNRLSGQLPASRMEGMSRRSLNILKGNIFSCNSVPTNDGYSRDYVCGSQNLNIAMALFATVFGVAVLLGLVVVLAHRMGHRVGAPLSSKAAALWTFMTFVSNLRANDHANSPVVEKIVLLVANLMQVARYAAKLLAVVLTGSLALYIVKLLDEGGVYVTHTHTYAWFWTLAHTRGVVPAALLLSVWAATVTACFYAIVLSPKKSEADSVTPQHGTMTKADLRKRASRVGANFVFNAAVTIAVNTLYIYSTQQALSPVTHFCIQLSLSIYRIVYMTAVLPLLAKPFSNSVQNIRSRLFLLTINNLLIPCIVTALTSDSCFQGLIVSADPVSTPYSYGTCTAFTTPNEGEEFCSSYEIHYVESAPLVPPFSYSNQCGSVVLTAYIPVFLLGYSIQMLLPLLVVMLWRYVPYSDMSPAVQSMEHGVLWPEHWLQVGRTDRSDHTTGTSSCDPRTILNFRTIICNDVCNNWLLSLTFGLYSPVLAVVIALSVLMKMSLWVLLIGRFTNIIMSKRGESSGLASAPPPNSSSSCRRVSGGHDSQREVEDHEALVALAAAYTPVIKVLGGSFWQLVWMSALFTALLSWEMAADEVKCQHALWVPMVPLVYVLALRCVAHLGREDLSPNEALSSSSSSSSSLPLSPPHSPQPAGVELNPLAKDHDMI